MSLVEPIMPWDAAAKAPAADLRRDFLVPLATIALLVVLALVVAVHFGVRALNQESAAREQHLVRNGLELRMEEVAKLVLPQVEWDDAVRNLDNRFDYAWADANIHEFLEHAYGFDAEYVLDGQNRPIFAAVGADKVSPSAYRGIAPHAHSLIQSVRRQESARGPLTRIAGPDMISQSIQASALKLVDGRLTILTATLVQPDFGTALPAGPRAPVVVTAMDLDQPFLEQFSNRFLLSDVRVRLPGQASDDARVEIPVTDSHGQIQAALSWKPHDPGYGMLRDMGLPVLQGLLVILAIAAFPLRHMLAAARRLISYDPFAWEPGVVVGIKQAA